MAVVHKQKSIKKSSLLQRTLVSWLCIAFLGWTVIFGWSLWAWGHEGFERSYKKVQDLSQKQAMAVREFSDASFSVWLSQRVTPALWEQSTAARNTAQWVGGKMTQVAQAQMDELLTPERAPIAEELSEFLNEYSLKTQQFWLLMSATGHVVLIKGAVLVAAIPLFLLAMTAGLIDGLNQRAIRTASLGRESTYVFHKSIPIARRLLFWVLGLWLAVPHALSPTPVFVSLSFLLALLVSVTSSRFKKYL